MSDIPESPHTNFIITKEGAFNQEAVERLARRVAERDAQLEALRKYARHNVFCRSVSGLGDCDCGLADALGDQVELVEVDQS